MDSTVVFWLMPLAILAYLALLARYLKHQDEPDSSKRGQTPGE